MTLRAERTQYSVPGWGVGELWTHGGVVLAHEFVFGPVSDTEGAAVPTGRHSSLSKKGESLARNASPTATQPRAAIDTVTAQFPLDRKRCLTPAALIARLTAFLAGEEVSLADVALDLDWTTPFQFAVADTLRAVPRGEVVGYGELAALAGYPGAARAVGGFCAGNRFMFLIPCHRVVGASGIGGYGSAGVEVKRRLLAFEGVRL